MFEAGIVIIMIGLMYGLYHLQRKRDKKEIASMPEDPIKQRVKNYNPPPKNESMPTYVPPHPKSIKISDKHRGPPKDPITAIKVLTKKKPAKKKKSKN